MPVTFSANVRIGTAGQQKVGILGIATVHVWVDGENVIDLYDWTIRNTKNGIAAMPPSRNGGPDPKNNGKTRWFNYYRMYPGDKVNDRRNELQKLILKEYYAATNQNQAPVDNPSPAPVASMPSVHNTPQQASSPAPPAPPSDADDWPY